MGIVLPSFVPYHLRVRFPTCTDSSIGQCILMTYCNLFNSIVIWNHFALCSRWLVMREGDKVAFCWRSGCDISFGDSPFNSEFLEHTK